MKTQGCPARVPSPWMEKKTSLTVSTAGAAARSLRVGGAASGGLPDPHPAQKTAFPAEPLAHLEKEVARDRLRRGALARERRVLVDVPVVEPGGDFAQHLLQALEVEDHTDPVQRLPRRDRFHAPIVPMDGLDGAALLGEPMRGAERRFVGDLEHR